MKIAFFDFDGTLTQRDTLMPFVKFCVGPKRYFLGLALLSPWLIGYLLKLVPNHVAKEKVLVWFLNGRDVTWLEQQGVAFAGTVGGQKLFAAGMQELNRCQQEGYQCWLVSASLECYLKPWASAQGMAGVFGCQLEQHEGRLTGRLRGANCYGEEKARIIGERFDLVNAATRGYGDTDADKYMLLLLGEAFFRRRENFVRLR